MEQKQPPQPNDFIKARRPELFSDTITVNEHVVDRNQLEFHLHTLTQRKEEIRFEYFCRRLAEKELCPNLIPQTGPTGGGDSKVDSETYPVAETIALRWYAGEATKAATERWAFAFSAKEKWRDKIKSDVKNIAETDRDYSRIYFITNQAVSDRKRAEVEDSLRKEWKRDIRLLDRTWIIDRVITNKRWDVLFQTLDIQDPRTEQQQTPGPLDATRTRELNELDTAIQDQNRYQEHDYQLAEDCLQTALLARGLNHPRQEVEGRFSRAERIARLRNDNRQLFRILYHKAWTALGWHNDYNELEQTYQTAEPLIIKTGNIWDLEKLVTLLIAGRTGQYHGRTHDWQPHRERLRKALEALASDQTKPTSALWARTQLLFLEIGETDGQQKKLSPLLEELNAILREATGLLEYPVEPIIQVIQELGDNIDDETYGELLENAITLKASRCSDAEQGRMRLNAGLQQLAAGKKYAATTQLGKAQTLLAKEEDKDDFVIALRATATAYEAAGLHWAARANQTIALDRTLYEHNKTGRIDKRALPILQRLLWTELQTGRPPCLLPWIKLFGLISNAIELEKGEREQQSLEYNHLDAVLGILILRTRFEDWTHLKHVPNLMERYGLLLSRCAALFALGQADTLQAEYEIGPDDAQEFFSQWLQQPAATDLPTDTEWMVNPTTQMSTTVLGCRINLSAENDRASLLLGEAILGLMESFLATTIMLQGHIATRPHLTIKITQDDKTTPPFNTVVEENDSGETSIILTHPGNNPIAIVQHPQYKDELTNLLAQLLSQLHIPFSKETIETLFARDRAQDRAFLTTQSQLVITNLLGDNPYQEENSSEFETFDLLRTEQWRPKQTTRETNGTAPSWGKGPPPASQTDMEGYKHDDLSVKSPINTPLWDKARWRGLGFLESIEDPVPAIALMFEDPEAGEKIFKGWHAQLDDQDATNLLSITLITGIDRDHPTHYRLAIGPNTDRLLAEEAPHRLFLTAMRMQDMTPQDNKNLERFLEAYKHAGSYKLMPGAFATPLGPAVEALALTMNELTILPAWEINPHSPLAAALKGITNPTEKP